MTFNVTANGSGGVVLTASAIITAVQLCTLNSVPVEVIETPGAGKDILVLNAAIQYKATSQAFPAGSAAALVLNGGATVCAFSTDFSATSTEETKAVGTTAVGAIGGLTNKALMLQTAADLGAIGAIASSVKNAGGLGYVLHDTGTIDGTAGDATYIVTSVGVAGAVTGYSITGAGTLYAAGTAITTTSGGAQAGIGTGFTIDVTSVTPGTGSARVDVTYVILDKLS